MRTFLAVRPPPDAVEHLAAALPRRPSATERWHVTLAFLDEVAEPDRLRAPLAELCAAARPLALRLAGSGTFGRGGPVWVGVTGEVAALTALAGDLAEACRRSGVPVERRPYRPHLTVGRRGRPDPALLAAYSGPSWTAAEVEVVTSRLGPAVEHRTIARLPLGAG